MATTHKKIKKIAMIFIQSVIPLAPNKEAKLQDDLSITTPTHVPINSNLEFKIRAERSPAQLDRI